MPQRGRAPRARCARRARCPTGRTCCALALARSSAPARPRRRALDLVEQRARRRVVGLSVEREAQVADQVVVTWIEAHLVTEVRQLPRKRLIEHLRVPPVVAVSGARVEQRVTREQRHLGPARQQAHVAHRVTGRVEALELDALAYADDVAAAQPPRHVWDRGVRMRQQRGAGRCDDVVVAADVVVVLMRVEDLGDVKSSLFGDAQARAVIERIDGERLAGLFASDQVVVLQAVPDQMRSTIMVRRASTASIVYLDRNPLSCSISRSVELVMLISVHLPIDTRRSPQL